jgi:hypothetical protein
MRQLSPYPVHCGCLMSHGLCRPLSCVYLVLRCVHNIMNSFGGRHWFHFHDRIIRETEIQEAETSVRSQRTAQRYIQEDIILQTGHVLCFAYY